MRIQHNIMAMNAYRNYTTNVNAMKSNLEKLSSGYKINRAGDDAAGLAISEKMRAQITGLNAAQKNVKDGISLVQTAEGAMQEVQDMLNRMVYLATQSANGTYDNEVDRDNLQKELNQLRGEINRIADSANFNGIKLLDGSKEAGFSKAGTEFTIPDVGPALGADTITMQEGNAAAKATVFGVDLGDVAIEGAAGDKVTVTVGDLALEVDWAETGTTGKMSSADVAAAIIAKYGAGGASEADVVFADKDGTDQTFTVAAGANGSELLFTQAAAPTAAGEVVDAAKTVTVATSGAAGTAAVAAVYNSATVTAVTDNTANNMTIGGYSTQIDGTAITDLADQLAAFVTAYNNDAANDEWTASVHADGDKITFTAKTAGALGTTGATPPTGATEATAGADAGAAGNAGTITGTYNKGTTQIQQGEEKKDSSLASTVISVTKDHFGDGATIKIGTKEYIMKTGADSKVTAGTGQTLVDLSNLNPDDTDFVEKAIKAFTDAAKGNEMFTIGDQAAAAGKITLHQQTTYVGAAIGEGVDLTTREGIQEQLSFRTAADSKGGKALTFQIGDTADDYNKLEVSIGDIHTSSLGIADISIADQDSAASAVEKIKAAINTVSGIRGDLGATQNRLEHTANNLSVMQENIQDAESSIRDTDVAEEMMAYTKNNILIQSAQAMLAQANQVPQGVLQLLQ